MMGGISGSHPSGQAPAGLGASRFDPGRSEVDNLRETLRAVIAHCGGGTSETVSSEFLCLAAEEVRLAIIAAERRGEFRAAKPVRQIRIDTICEGCVGSSYLDVERIEEEDDGSLTVIGVEFGKETVAALREKSA